MNAGVMTVSSSARTSPRQSVRRFAALAWAEGVLLRRNRIALLTAGAFLPPWSCGSGPPALTLAGPGAWRRQCW